MLAEWIKSVLISALMFSVMVHTAPNPQMKRYVQTAVGFVMIIVVLTPVLELMKCEDRLTFDVLTESLDAGVSENEDEVYISAMQEVVETYIWDVYGVRADVVITVSDGMEIEMITATIDYRYMSESGVSISDDIGAVMTEGLADEYGVDESRVLVI